MNTPAEEAVRLKYQKVLFERYVRELDLMTPEERKAARFDFEEEMLRRGWVPIAYEASHSEHTDFQRRKAALKEFNKRHNNIGLTVGEVTFTPFRPDREAKPKTNKPKGKKS